MNAPATLVLPAPVAILPVAANAGYLLTAEEIRSAFAAQRVYPLTPTAAGPGDDVLRWYAEWLRVTGTRFEAAAEPWVPVGRVGPLLILGHHDLGAPAMLPRAWFQPVLLRKSDYEKSRARCAAHLAGGATRGGGDELMPPRRLFPGPDGGVVSPTTLRAALRFLIEYFPQERTDLARVQDLLLHAEEFTIDDLPAGYFGACWALLGRGAVADPDVAAVAEAVARRMPAALGSRARIVSEYGRNLWVAVAQLPQPEVEDLLLNELGEGWRVYLLLADPARRGAAPDGGGGAHPAGGYGERLRVRIEDRRSSEKDRSAQPGVIRLSQKDLRELEAYNARRPDRDPLKVFLKELAAGIRHGATDLHIEPGLDSARVRARRDGYLEEWLEMPLDFGRMVIGAAKEQFGMPPERWAPQDGAATVHHGTDVVNLRVAAYPVRGLGQKLAIRYLPRRGEVPRLAELMPEREATLLRRAITRPYGLILLCGPTGSGKTTTTFSALAEINSPDVNITTMEDPVEYEMDGVNQAELDRVRGVDWDALLAGFLRQDPDVGMVGEIRDRQTAETAIRLTLTGHIVFATLHTMSCAHTVERLVDSGVNAQMFAHAATLIVSQRLVRRLCRRCKDAGRRAPTEAERAVFAHHGIEPPVALYDPVTGTCPECRGGGYRGQVAAFELLPITPEVARLIVEKRPVDAIEQWMQAHHFRTVYGAALALAARGETSLAEANQWQPVWDAAVIPARAESA